jgi:antitoxin (DNA-binding transcriptional repressor) of toxin-antitoxin stability system
MRFVSVGEFKAHFSGLLEEVLKGDVIGVCYGRRKKPVAVLMPVPKTNPQHRRPLGLWKGQMSFRFPETSQLSDEDFLRS